MWDVADGVVTAVFGLVLVDRWYEADAGEAEFRGGKLVRLRIGDRAAQQNPRFRPLTVGFTYFPDLALGSALAGLPRGADRYVRTAGFTRVYADGVLVEEITLGVVHVTVDRIAGG